MIELSIVIPVYNSEKTIVRVTKEIDELLKNRVAYEVILINDNSKDNSYNFCKEIVEKNENVKLIELSKNFGQHSAIMAGYHLAKGTYILSMDDDLQTAPEEILKLVDKIKIGSYDVVYAQYKTKKHNKIRNIGSSINDKMAKALIGKEEGYTLTSFFIMKKYIKDEVLNYTGPYPYLGGLILRITQNIGTLDVIHKERAVGKSNYTLKKLIKLMLDGFTSFSIKPLRVAGILGVFISAISVLVSISLVLKKLIHQDYILAGWTSTIVTILFFMGIQLIFLGLIGEYVGRIFLSMNNQPQFVIKEVYINKNLND